MRGKAFMVNATFKLVMLGFPSSGKTAFLTMLVCDDYEGISDQQVRGDLKTYYENLSKGEAIEATRSKADPPGIDYSFSGSMENKKDRITLQIKDFAGEETRKLRHDLDESEVSNGTFHGAVHASHAILVLCDCHAIVNAGGWKAWYDEYLSKIMQHIEEVISEDRRHPVTILLTRSDLVSPKRFEQINADATAGCAALRLDCKVQGFRAFTNRAEHQPSTQDGVLQNDHLIPEGSPVASPPPKDIISELYRRHKRTRKPRVHRLVLVGIGALLIALFSLQALLDDSPPSPEELAKAFSKIPVGQMHDEAVARELGGDVYVDPSEGEGVPPWSRMARAHFELDRERQDEDQQKLLRQAKQAYLQAAKNESLRLVEVDGFAFKPRQGWMPKKNAEAVRAYEYDLREWEGPDARHAIFEKKKAELNKLEKGYADKNADKNDTSPQRAIAEEYLHMGYPVPEWVQGNLTDLVYSKALHDVADKLKEHESGDHGQYEELYETTIPGILAEVLSLDPKMLAHDKRQQIQEAQDYLKVLRSFDRLNLPFTKIHNKGIFKAEYEEVFSSDFCFYLVYQPDGITGTKRYFDLVSGADGPFSPQMASKGEINIWGDFGQIAYEYNSLKPWEAEWRYGMRFHFVVVDEGYVFTHHHGMNSGSYKSDDYLPGLTFLMFRRVINEWCDIDKTRTRLDELFEVPEFLKAANQERME